jgi:hypothetical protein
MINQKKNYSSVDSKKSDKRKSLARRPSFYGVVKPHSRYNVLNVL